MKSTLTSLRALALSRLMQYRKYRNFLRQKDINLRAANAPFDRGASHAVRPADPAAREVSQMRGWVRAIDRVRAKLAEENPKKARFMDRCFGLDSTSPMQTRARSCLIEQTIAMNISESTAYKWREAILDLVLFSAIEGGVLAPFGCKKESADPSDQSD